MKKIILGLSFLLSMSIFGSETCKLKERRGFHPDGTPSRKISFICTDLDLQREILLKYDAYRIGKTLFFVKTIKSQIIKDITSMGYRKVNYNTYLKN